MTDASYYKEDQCADYRRNADTLVQELLGKIDEMLAAFPEEKILGIGIGAIGPDDLIRGRILKPTDFHGIHDLDLKKEIASIHTSRFI